MSSARRSPLAVGVIGCGTISDSYLQALTLIPEVTPIACADRCPARADAMAATYGLRAEPDPSRLWNDDAVDIVLNLTVPAAHADVTLAALAAGKHVYTEKPLATNRADADRILAAADDRNLLVGCAPDTFLGPGLQTCRRLVDEGAIGELTAGVGFFGCPGHEIWHPQPDFYYEDGGGPLYDMGPYHITALVNLLGPVAKVWGSARGSDGTRVVGLEQAARRTIQVKVPTHVSCTIEFVGGQIVTCVFSFDVPASEFPHLELYGNRGTLSVPDPSRFDGTVRIFRTGSPGWEDVPPVRGLGTRRGIGLAALARAIRQHEPHRASAELARHVVDVMQAIDEACLRRSEVHVTSRCPRPEPAPD